MKKSVFLMKQYIWVFIAILLAGIFVFPGFASALAENGDVSVEVTVEPDEMKESGPASFEFTVANLSNKQLSGINVLYDGTVLAMEDGDEIIIPPKGAACFKVHWVVPEQCIGKEISLQVEYVKNDGKLVLDVPVMVKRSQGSGTPGTKVPEGDEVRVSVALEPEEITESGPVTLEFTVSNYSDFELNDLSVKLDGKKLSVDHIDGIRIPPNGSAQFKTQWTVPDARIGLQTSFLVSYVKYGETYSVEVPVTVKRASDPIIEVNRKVSQEYARKGETITVTYELVNSTVFDMTDITLYDSNVSTSPILRNHTLNAGGSVTQVYVYTMGDKDVESAPIVTYEVNGNTKTFSAVEPVQLKMVNVELSLDVEMGTPSMTGVPFTITVENTGNTEVKNIEIADERGNKVTGSTFSLKPGNQYVVSYTVVPLLTENSRTVAFSISGIDGYGAEYNATADSTFTVYPYIEDSQVAVTMTAEITGDWQQDSGTIAVKVSITNLSDVVLTGASLVEAQLGELTNFENLANGVTVYEGTLTIGSPRNLNFILTAYDPAGTQRQLTAASLLVAQPAATQSPVPQTTEMPEIQGEEVTGQSGISRLIMIILITVGSIIVLGLVAVILLSVLEHRSTGGINLDIQGEEEEQEDELLLILDDEPKNSSDIPEKRSAESKNASVRQNAGDRPRNAESYMRAANERRSFNPQRYDEGETTVISVKKETEITDNISIAEKTETVKENDSIRVNGQGMFHGMDAAPKLETEGTGVKVPAFLAEKNEVNAGTTVKHAAPRRVEGARKPAVRPVEGQKLTRVTPFDKNWEESNE